MRRALACALLNEVKERYFSSLLFSSLAPHFLRNPSASCPHAMRTFRGQVADSPLEDCELHPSAWHPKPASLRTFRCALQSQRCGHPLDDLQAIRCRPAPDQARRPRSCGQWPGPSIRAEHHPRCDRQPWPKASTGHRRSLPQAGPSGRKGATPLGHPTGWCAS